MVSLSRQVLRRFARGSREISPVSSIYRASTDALMKKWTCHLELRRRFFLIAANRRLIVFSFSWCQTHRMIYCCSVGKHSGWWYDLVAPTPWTVPYIPCANVIAHAHGDSLCSDAHDRLREPGIINWRLTMQWCTRPPPRTGYYKPPQV